MTRKFKAKPAIASMPNNTENSTDLDFPIVGIGASAGGLAAFEAFFSGMPEGLEPGMAFVLVQHLAPDHKSILSELLTRYTKMQVTEVTDGVSIQPNCAYIIPPNRDMALLNRSLQLFEPSAPRGQRLPIDFFFKSLADDQKERAICIVLSGSGSDGTLGVQAVKAMGGMVMVQAPTTAEYDSMPRNAIASGLADFVLPPAEMLPQLMSYSRHAFSSKLLPLLPLATSLEDELSKIFVLLRAHTTHDFSQYKRNTIIRRIERRMAVHQIEKINDYVKLCQHKSIEVKALFRDLLIGVTQFFRDPEEFEALAQHTIPRLFAGKSANDSVRVWVPGCSTGEEAYSFAILLQEHLESLQANLKLQVFATDIDSRAIETARAGIYPLTVASDISRTRLTRFFTEESEGRGYRIRKNIRDLVVFSEQDVIKDPPFSKLDLISCRNLLIYLSGELQKKLIPLFHYALNPAGFLFLGTSESIGDFVDLFAAVDRKSKIYQRKDDIQAGYRLVTGGKFIPPLPVSLTRADGTVGNEAKISLKELTERALLQQFAAVAVLVTERGDILYLHGRTGRFLEPAPGEAGMSILRMAREGLRSSLTTALHAAASLDETVCVSGLRVKTNGDFSNVDLTVTPVVAHISRIDEPALFLVVLQDSSLPDQISAAVAAPVQDGRDNLLDCDSNVVAGLRQELRAKEEYLQSNIEELETSNEELKSANEEMQSVNEELQSANEELETSKEELQSVNEELATVNSELQSKLIDLARTNNDMNNLLSSTDIGTVFVDHQLNIQRFTPSVTQVINLIASDVGRPVGHIVSNLLAYNTLVEDLQRVLDTLVPAEIEVQTVSGAWFLLRIRPYRTVENVIEGAVITFVDITELKRAQALLGETAAYRHLAAVIHDARDAILMVDPQGFIQTWNPAAERLYGWSAAEACQKNIRELVPEELREQALAITKQLSQADALAPYATERICKDGSRIAVLITATALLNPEGEMYAITTTERAQPQKNKFVVSDTENS